MNKISFLSQPAVQKFIEEHIHQKVSALAFQKHSFKPEEWTLLLQQIQAKQKSEHKLPKWFHQKGVVFPSTLSVEQTSSEPLAKYKAAQIGGKNIIDLTGGFGVDAFAFTSHFEQVVYCEIQEELCALVTHNAELFKLKNIATNAKDGLEYLQENNSQFDWIYIDPARRNDKLKKVFLLEDCTPNVPELLELYFQYTQHILIKSAPLLDLVAGCKELKYVKKIEIVSLQNEVKEVLWFLEKDYKGTIEVKATNINKNNEITFYTHSFTDDAHCEYSAPKTYIYEPYACLLKTGHFNAIANTYGLQKLAQHTHLYTSDQLVSFPGRRFEITEQISFHKPLVKQTLGQKKAHVSTRNFPLKVDEIRKMFKILEGEQVYTFFTTNAQQEKIVLLTKKTEDL